MSVARPPRGPTSSALGPPVPGARRRSPVRCMPRRPRLSTCAKARGRPLHLDRSYFGFLSKEMLPGSRFRMAEGCSRATTWVLPATFMVAMAWRAARPTPVNWDDERCCSTTATPTVRRRRSPPPRDTRTAGTARARSCAQRSSSSPSPFRSASSATPITSATAPASTGSARSERSLRSPSSSPHTPHQPAMGRPRTAVALNDKSVPPELLLQRATSTDRIEDVLARPSC